MAKFIYCSQCGLKSNVVRKAIAGYGRIIDLVDPHVCLEEPANLDLTPTEVPRETGNREFVKNLNGLEKPGEVSTFDLRDRRVETDVKSTAPISVLDHVKTSGSSHPEGDINVEPVEE